MLISVHDKYSFGDLRFDLHRQIRTDKSDTPALSRAKKVQVCGSLVANRIGDP